MIDTENQTKETPPNKGGTGKILNFKIRFDVKIIAFAEFGVVNIFENRLQKFVFTLRR